MGEVARCVEVVVAVCKEGRFGRCDHGTEASTLRG